ncbi:LOW QUALITY PROTEIN: hypothetical protein O9K51_04799 [Purpureocillium lavendulum]|uniref:Uncharacterized protein n=1 Tax=Purpureocillium lavendulum TaxID=1247861 RepID=A0AB34FWA4_9HYPO|nr:LOW QUALITY PROTEIN: hypothetical protein O9K51_04799 [Purpureocillium lavendulum]
MLQVFETETERDQCLRAVERVDELERGLRHEKSRVASAREQAKKWANKATDKEQAENLATLNLAKVNAPLAEERAAREAADDNAAATEKQLSQLLDEARQKISALKGEPQAVKTSAEKQAPDHEKQLSEERAALEHVEGELNKASEEVRRQKAEVEKLSHEQHETLKRSVGAGSETSETKRQRAEEELPELAAFMRDMSHRLSDVHLAASTSRRFRLDKVACEMVLADKGPRDLKVSLRRFCDSVEPGKFYCFHSLTYRGGRADTMTAVEENCECPRHGHSCIRVGVVRENRKRLFDFRGTQSSRLRHILTKAARVWKPLMPARGVSDTSRVVAGLLVAAENLRTGLSDEAEMLGYAPQNNNEYAELLQNVEKLRLERQAIVDSFCVHTEREVNLGYESRNDGTDMSPAEEHDKVLDDVVEALSMWLQVDGDRVEIFFRLLRALPDDLAAQVSTMIAQRPVTIPATPGVLEGALGDRENALDDVRLDNDVLKKRSENLEEKLHLTEYELAKAKDDLTSERQSPQLSGQKLEFRSANDAIETARDEHRASIERLNTEAREEKEAASRTLEEERQKVADLGSSLENKENEFEQLRGQLSTLYAHDDIAIGITKMREDQARYQSQLKGLYDAEKKRASGTIVDARDRAQAQETQLRTKRLQGEVARKDGIVRSTNKVLDGRVLVIQGLVKERDVLLKETNRHLEVTENAVASESARLVANLSRFLGQLVPPQAEGGWDAFARQALGDAVFHTREAHSSRSPWTVVWPHVKVTATLGYHEAFFALMRALVSGVWDPLGCPVALDGFRRALSNSVPDKALAWTPKAAMDGLLAALERGDVPTLDRLAVYELLMGLGDQFPSDAATATVETAKSMLGAARLLEDICADDGGTTSSAYIAVSEQQLGLLIEHTAGVPTAVILIVPREALAGVTIWSHLLG